MTLDVVWRRLASVQHLTFQATSTLATGWNGCGSGTVVVEHIDGDVLLFNEHGQWSPSGQAPLSFSNVYRWTWVRDTSTIRLEHLRFGWDQPVYLLDFARSGDGRVLSVEPHVCRDDLYSAELAVADSRVRLDWSIKGPAKNEAIKYVYQ